MPSSVNLHSLDATTRSFSTLSHLENQIACSRAVKSAEEWKKWTKHYVASKLKTGKSESTWVRIMNCNWTFFCSAMMFPLFLSQSWLNTVPKVLWQVSWYLDYENVSRICFKQIQEGNDDKNWKLSDNVIYYLAELKLIWFDLVAIFHFADETRQLEFKMTIYHLLCPSYQ